MTRLEELIQRHRSLSDSTKLSYAKQIRDFTRFAGDEPSNWTPKAVEDWLVSLQERKVQPQAANTYLSALKTASRRFAEIDGGQDFAKASEFFRVNSDVRMAQKSKRALTREEAERLLATCPLDGTPTDIRDRGIIMLALCHGLRRAEMTWLKWDWFHGLTLAVLGKGGGTVEIQLQPQTKAVLELWKANARCKGAETPIFHSLQLTLEPRDCKPLSLDAINKIIGQRTARAGLRDVTPHTLRHSFVTLMLEAGVDPFEVMRLARHRNLTMTMNTYYHPKKGPSGLIFE